MTEGTGMAEHTGELPPAGDRFRPAELGPGGCRRPIPIPAGPAPLFGVRPVGPALLFGGCRRWSRRLGDMPNVTERSSRAGRATVLRWLPLAALAAIAIRLPLLGVPLDADEGGYAYLARRWRGGRCRLVRPAARRLAAGAGRRLRRDRAADEAERLRRAGRRPGVCLCRQPNPGRRGGAAGRRRPVRAGPAACRADRLVGLVVR